MSNEAGLQSGTGGQPVSATPPPSTPSTASSPPSTVQSIGSNSDPWAEAEAAYNSAGDGDAFGDLPNAVLEDFEGQEQGQSGPKGTTEQPAAKTTNPEPKNGQDPTQGEAPTELDGENFWSTDGLDTPEKIASRLKKIQAFQTKKNQESKAESEKLKESNTAMAKLIAQVSMDPENLGPLLQQYGKDLEASGIPVNWKAINSIASGNNPTDDKVTAVSETKEFIEQKSSYIDGAAKHLLESKDDSDFGRRVGELVWHAHQQAMQEIQKTVQHLKEFTQQTAAEKVEPLIRKTQTEQKVNMWSSAISDLSSDKDLEGFANAVKEGPDGLTEMDRFIQNDPMLKLWAAAINRNPEAAAERGITPKSLLKRAFNEFSLPQRIRDAEERARKALQSKIEGAGEIPGSHTQTTRTGGMDWAEIEKEDGDPFRDL